MPNNFMDDGFESSNRDWVSQEISNLTEKIAIASPHEWAESNRYLPANITPLPGYYSYDITPALKEIVDCMDIRSSVREITLMKGAQIGATVGVLENAIGYYISQVKSSPMMLLTADSELAKIRMDGHITIMLQQSGLAELIKSSDELTRNKTGKTNQKIEWIGGGYLLPFGARNAAKLRSNPIQILLEDEIDGYPDIVGKDGDPMKLAEGRTKSYSQTRKILRLSTPLLKGSSRIERAYLEGDQRKFHVPCKKCGKFQELKFYRQEESTGVISGLVYETDAHGILKQETVKYLCEFCQHPHVNADKTWMMPRGKWVATARSQTPNTRSYHLSAMYSAAAMFSWDDIVRDYLNCWDIKENRPKDLGLMQEFYNNVLGKTFELRGKKISYKFIMQARREYKYGDIPNIFAQEFSGGKILLLTCAVDVHKDNLAVAVFGWTRGARSYLIDYWTFEGDPTQEEDDGTWGRLSKLLEGDGYSADDGSMYHIALTLIDSGYLPDQVYRFCEKYTAGVYPIKGRENPPKAAAIKEFSPFVSRLGTTVYGITVNFYKDRMSAVLSRDWDGIGLQFERCVNFPKDATEKQLKELTAEQKREKINRVTKQRDGFEWYRRPGAKNELWDLLIYNSTAIDIVALQICQGNLNLDYVNWVAFWDYLESEKLFYTQV